MVALVKQTQSNTHLPIDEVIHGDALLVLRSLPSNSVDAIVSDPPAAVSFMGKSWDSDKGGRTQWVAWLSEIMQEALRCLKPGGYGLIWALPRTSHWTALALEDAGFIVKDCVSHIFGSGFPKSMDISKAIDRMQGADREVIRTDKHGTKAIWGSTNETNDITAPATPEAQQWAGYGTALKPSTEFWWLVQKPISEKTIAANVLKWGTGGLAIDKCRVASDGSHMRPYQPTNNDRAVYGEQTGFMPTNNSKRFPSHLLLSHSVWCVPRGVKRVKGSHDGGKPVPYRETSIFGGIADRGIGVNRGAGTGYADPDGMEEVEDWECVEDCPVRLLNEQSGIRKTSQPGTSARVPKFSGKVYNASITPQKEWGYGDTGGASRYFQTFHYFSKASRTERNQGCEGLPEQTTVQFNDGMIGAVRSDGTIVKPAISQSNHHPTVKSLSLMSWLCKLITPPDGIVLDPFLGSGSTAVAAIHEGFHFIGIEAEAEYVAICEARIAHAWEVCP